MNRVWENSRATGPAFVVMLALADYANTDGVAWPAVEKLAEKTRCSERSVHRALKWLEEEIHELRIEHNKAQHRRNRYQLLLKATPPHPARETPSASHPDTLSPCQPVPKRVPHSPKEGARESDDPVKDPSGSRQRRGDRPKRAFPSSPPAAAEQDKPGGRTRAEIEADLARETDPEKRRRLVNEFMNAE